MENRSKKAKRYSRIKEYLSLVSIPIEIIFLFLMIFYFSEIFVGLAGNLTVSYYLKIIIYGSMFFIFHTIFMLPINFFSGYILENKFNLSNENIWGWLVFQLKSLAFTFILGLPLFLLFYFIINRFDIWWWFIAASCFFVISLFLSYIFPFIIPFFYNLIPLDNEELKSKIRSIIEKGGLELKGVFKIALGERTKKANAALTGMGKTKRVLLSDTLLDSDIKDPEIVSITAHEVGHYVYKHLWKSIIVELVSSYGTFYVIYLLIEGLIKILSDGGVTNIVNLPIIMLIFTLFNLLTKPISNFFTRMFEYQADSYAARESSPQDYISSLDKLAYLNLADKNPPRILEVLLHSHPSIKHRKEAIRKEFNL